MPKSKTDFTNFVDARPNYFPGQFLLEDDFEVEQKYLIDRQKYHRQSLHVSGIVEGLEVEVIKDKQEVLIKSGSGINSNGDLIVLKKDTSFSQFASLTNGELYISYREEKQIQQQEDFTRWQEVPTIGFADTTPNHGVKLAKISIVNNVLTLDLTVRDYSGIFLPNATGNDLTLRSGGNANPNVAILNGSLTVTGTITGKIDATNINSENLTVTNVLKIGQDATGVTRDWMKRGMSILWDTDNLFIGLKDEGSNRKDAVIAWGDDPQDDLRFIHVQAGGAANGTEVLRVKPSGNVGIGTVIPSEKLEVSGNLKVTGTITGNINATNINSGVLDIARIPDLPPNKIASGTLTVDRIPNLPADKITSGTIQGSLTINTGGASGWDKLVVNTTANWGDGNTQYVTIGAGGGAGIMLHNPHVSWQSGEKRASIRYGRSGGVSSGSWWDVGARDSGAFSFVTNGNFTNHAMTIDSSGNLRVSGAITPSAGNSESNGIMFPLNPGGGGGDAAWIRYWARSGEATTFEIGTSNDPDDILQLTAPKIQSNVSIQLSSSRDFKENITDISCEDALKMITKLRPVKYDYKNRKDFRQILGFIAEEMPVELASKDYKAISPMEMIPVLTKVLQRQQEQIELLSQKIFLG
jgi:hypothetical protein